MTLVSATIAFLAAKIIITYLVAVIPSIGGAV
jgi:hypothetical protein